MQLIVFKTLFKGNIFSFWPGGGYGWGWMVTDGGRDGWGWVQMGVVTDGGAWQGVLTYQPILRLA